MRSRACGFASLAALKHLRTSDARNAVIVLRENRHDDGLVHDIPSIDEPGETAHVARDPFELLGEDGLVVVFHEPVRAGGMPAERMALEREAHGLSALGSSQDEALRIGIAFLLLVSPPIEGKRTRVPDVEDALAVCRKPVAFEHGQAENVRSEEELVRELPDDGLCAGNAAIDSEIVEAVLPDRRAEILHVLKTSVRLFQGRVRHLIQY
jgi:hypothetical protein